MIRLVYETHSTTVDNEAGVATGWSHGELSETGRERARALGERRRDPLPDAVFSSDRARAIDTARLAFGEAVPLFLDWRLRECDYGRFTGGPAARIAAERLAHLDDPWPDGESYRGVVARTGSFLDDLRRGWDGRYVVVIGHAATRWALEHLLGGTPLEELVRAPFDWQPGWEYRVS